MGLFNKKKDKVVDLTAYYEKNKEKFDNLPENQAKPEYEEIPINPSNSPAVSPKINTTAEKTSTSGSSGGFFGGFFGGASNSANAETTSSTPGMSDSVNPDERRRKLAKRLGDMTSKIEELSNQIYHLQQRLEVVERKLDVNRF